MKEKQYSYSDCQMKNCNKSNLYLQSFITKVSDLDFLLPVHVIDGNHTHLECGRLWVQSQLTLSVVDCWFNHSSP